MRRSALLAAVCWLLWPTPAAAQDPSLLCNFQLATAGGQALTCPQGGIRNIVDIEGGTEVYENGRLDRGKLRLNISGGETVDRNTGQLVREAIALNPDVGGCTIVFDGREQPLASFCPTDLSPPGIRFYTAPLVCGLYCVDPYARAVRRIRRLELRVRRLGRVVRGLRHR